MSDSSPKPPFKCPTSGQMLGALVSAFRLHLPSVGGPSAEFLGSGNAGKRARDYFEGKMLPEATRHEICTWVVRALLHSKMLSEIRIPATPSGGAPDIEQTFRIALFTWLQLWDAVFVASAARWPAADGALSGFVMGRQVVIDLALRWGAFCHYSGIGDPQVIAFEDGRTGRGKGILEAAIKMTGKDLTREKLAKALRKARPGKVNDRTVDRWFDELVIPDDVNLSAMASALTDGLESGNGMLRFLRLQYGMLRLVMMVRDGIGPRLCDLLVDGLVKFVRSSIVFNQVADSATKNDARQSQLFEIATFKLLIKGSGDPVNAGWINAWLRDEQGPVWHDDLQYAGNGAVVSRIQSCLKVVGAWPQLEAAAARYAASLPGGKVPGRDFLDRAAIILMNDNRVTPAMAQWMTENPDVYQKVVSDDQMKAATRAEQGTAAMNEGDYDGAISHWARAAALETDLRRKSNYLFFYGCCLWLARARRFDDAIEALNESFRLWPEQVPQRDRPFVEIAIIYQHRGRFDLALEHLDTDPSGFATTSGHFNFVKGRTLHAMHRWKEALDCLERAITLEADSRPDAFDVAADCAFRLDATTPNRDMAQKGRAYAKKALHLGRHVAHDKWGVG